jgi:hypothetical protein
MVRPPLRIGTSGRVRTYRTPSGWRARTTYRDYDGVTREVERHGRTKAAAERLLATAVSNRAYSGGGAELSRLPGVGVGRGLVRRCRPPRTQPGHDGGVPASAGPAHLDSTWRCPGAELTVGVVDRHLLP